MMDGTDSPPEMLDLSFDLRGDQLPRDHREALWIAIRGCLPWLEGTPGAGIHAIRAAHTDYGVSLLPRRAKLVLRVPASRIDEARALERAILDVAGNPLEVGSAVVRDLPSAGTLYADFVTTSSQTKRAFRRTSPANWHG